ncbi:Neurogenic locus Notch protein [Dirofilaria immitis]
MIPSSYVIYTSTLLGIILATFRYNYHIGNVKFSCMEGWTLYGNSCYIVVQEELSWTEANNLCASQRYNYSRSIALHDWFLMRDMSVGLLNSTNNYWTAFYYRGSEDSKRQNCRAANAVLHAKYYSYTTSIYNPLWSSQQPKVEYCTTNSCIYIHANFSDQINYGWKMADCSVKYPTICETFSCLEDYQYRCNDNSKCYPRKGRCDGIQECSDNSDEADCSKRRAKCGKTLFEDEANEINFEMSSAEYASCQWTIRQPVDSKIILTLVNVNIRDNDELIISGIQDSTMNATSNLQIVSNMSVAKAQYTSIGNTLTITFRSQKIDSTIVNMINIILKFSYITQGKYCFLPIIGYGSVINVTGFEMGDVLYFECHLGYQTSSGQFSLSRCNNGRWTPKPKCKLLNCGSAAALYNNAILTDYTRNLTLYSRALYSCEPGLHINGSSPPFRLCTENGTWTNPDFSCQASVCYATSFAYGHFVEQFYANGTTGKYVCDEGFYQKETDPVCIYGTWKGTPYCYPEHSCYHNPCGNGTCIQLTGGYSCICYEGFRMISTSKGYICSDIDECSTPGYSLCEFTCINTIGSYECKCPDTHQLYTDPNSVKNLVSNTEFLILNRTCIEKKCTVPEIPPNVIPYPLYTDPFSYQNGLYHTDTVIYFACDHPVSNYTSLVCNKTESWVVLNPCLGLTCKPPEITKKNLMIWPIKKSYKFKDEIHFFCDKPYHLNGPSSSYCIGVDKWSLTKLPDCIVRRCPGLELDGYEVISMNNKTDNAETNLEMFFQSATHIVDTPGYSLSIICKNGEKFANGQTKILLVCMHNYTWNLNSLPACIREEDTQRNQSDDNNAMMNEYSKNCIRDTVSDVHVNMNTSAMLWCFLSANCTNITSIKWYRNDHQNISGISLKGKNGSWGLFFESVKVDDDGRYYCAVIDKNQEVLEKYPADLYVYQTFETGRSWPEIVQNSEPIKEILFTADNNDWSIISETVSVEDSGIFDERRSTNRNWLFQQVVLLSDHRLNFFQKEICSQHSYLFVGIRGDVNSVVLKSVKIYAIKCPEVRVNFALFPQTAAIKDGIIVTGQCLHGAHTIIQGQNPKLFCTQHGKWIYDVQSANLCFCSSNYTSENDICVERGPICYICSGNNGTDCNDSSAVFCDRKQYCFTQITKILEGDVVRKGCTNECTASRIGCKTREETCEMCCQEDYCNNWHNMSKIHDEYLRPYRMFRAICPRNITVLRYSKELFSAPTIIPPLIHNYEPFYHLIVDQDIFNGTLQLIEKTNLILWTVTNRMSQFRNCSTHVFYKDYWAPVLDCPSLYIDFLANTTSLKFRSRFPNIDYRDVGSRVSLHYIPPNGTVVELGQPVKVTVTATDESNNSARCLFWYIGQVADCPLWPINETEYECRGSMNQRVCKRRRECTGIQFPHHVTSLKCVAGQGWSYVSTQSTAVVPMNLFRPPICLKNSADVVYLSVNLATNSSLDEPCKAALILKLHQLPKTYNAICRQLEWTFTGLLIVDNNMFANYTMRHENISTTFKCAAQIVRRIIREKLGFNALKVICKNIQFSALYANYSNTCSKKECAPGFYSAANGCYPCPLHSYSETIGIKNCTKCPENTFTPKTGSFSSQLCRKQCPPGFFSPTGLEPCQACGIGFYQPLYGLKSCNNCTSPWTTSAVGSISASECVLKCKPGWFSSTGFEPCMKCPVGFYQDRAGQTTCNTCLINANNKQISINNHCEGFSCTKSGCKNNGKCLNGRCICPFFYIGLDCSVALNLCLANFCPESGECRFDGVITSCVYNSDPLAEVSRMTWLESLWKLKQQKQQRQLSNEETLKAMNDSSLLTSPIRLANTSTKLKTVSELVDKQFSVWSHNRRIRRNENKETVISTGKYSSISDQAESFISDQLASSETGTTQEWKSDLSHRAKFVTTFSPSLIKTGVHERNSIKSITTTSTVLITINATSAICSNRLNFCKNGSCVTNNHGNISCVCREGYKINGSDNCILLQNCDYNPCGENSCKNINNEYFCQCSTAHDTFHRQKWCPSSKECDQKNLCKNNGISICDYKSQCICPTSYYGKFCTEKAEPCKNLPCDHGTCIAQFDHLQPYYFCKCDPGYYGEECTAHATCIDRNINCKHGYCYKNDKTAYCKCYPGFTGSDCSIEINHCTSSPCVNGTCKPKFLGYTCICDESHKGDRCEILIDPCDRKPCNINSECRALSYGYKGKFVCNCAAGWTGKYCNELIDLCSHSQCGFGSTCITRPGVNGDISYVCICPLNKAGTFCNESVDYCKPMNPCLHEGICQQRDDGYTCLCKPGYRGDHCQYNLCSPNPCQNGGNCTVLSLTTYNCSCPQYYGGINCTVITDACAVSNFEDYCLNDGKCISNNFEPICHCTYQYEGRRCANKKDLDFNVMFNEQSQNLTSTSFDGSILKQFTLCFWIRIISMDNNSFASFLNINQQGFAKNILSITKNVVKFGKHVGLTNMTENQWQQFCFRRKMDGTTDWIRNGEIVWERKWDISPINGSLRILLGSAQSFQAEMSMVQLYSTVVRNKQINYSIRYCKQWLQSIIARICTFSECLLNPHRCSLAADKVPPKVINCPSNINITSKDRLTIVNWFPSKSNEIFAGNDIINTSSNYNSGDVFTWGKYHIVYIAQDKAGNIETCQFDLVIATMNCSNPKKTDGINFTIRNIYSENVQKVAFVECETNYMPIHSVTDFYFCDLMGQWTRWPHGINFYFPSCLEYQAPLQQLSGLVTITANCRKLEVYKKNLTAVILNANKQFNHFCTTLNCSNELKIWSNSSCKNRVLRQSANQTAESMYLYFSISANTTIKSIESVITENLNKVFGNNTGKPNTSWQCPSKNYPIQIFGHDTHSCVKCPSGMYCLDNKCIPCPENTFKKSSGCNQCIPCPNNTITGPIIDDIGYQSIFDCYTNCSAGHYYSIQEGSCVKCPKGMYQDRPGQLRCNACPESRSTLERGSVNVSNCTVTCGAGMSMSEQSQCVKCAKGKYRQENSAEVRCTSCPDYFTTPDNGSVNQSNCTVLNCPPGTYINLSSPSECFFCPRNHYQEKSNQTECRPCVKPLITLAMGSVHPRQCMKPLFWNPVISDVNISKNFNSSLRPVFGFICFIGAIALLALFYFQRQRIRALFCKVRRTQLKHIATTNYYRDASFTYPIVTITPTNIIGTPDFAEGIVSKNLEPREMVEIYQEIYDGLHSMAEGTSRMPNDELASNQHSASISRVRLEVDTTLRAEFCGDPKAIGMDSSGFPIDSADYEHADQCKSMDLGNFENSQSSAFEENQTSGFQRRFGAYRNWNLRIPLDEMYTEPTEYKLFLPGASDVSIEETSGILRDENKDRENKDEESDDEDYFG